MIFEKYLLPDKLFDSFRDITPEALLGLGIRHIFADIDNTLATYDDPTPPPEVTEWVESMRGAGISFACVSNNNAARVSGFCAPLGCRFYAKAGKPGTGALRRAMEDAGAEPGNSLCLGDQLLTDCAAGKRLGMTVFIVPPIRDKTTLFWRIKRGIEKPYMKKFAALRMKQGEAETKQTKAKTK